MILGKRALSSARYSPPPWSKTITLESFFVVGSYRSIYAYAVSLILTKVDSRICGAERMKKISRSRL
ncbi:hypothetical protein HRbin07_00650 [bacterium HR07]|nr:hypothetical protein HRbin07_00650 [bacterium HR07]